MIAEPDVAVTDWVLAIEAAALAVALPRRGRARVAWAAFFVSIAVAALLGGVAHGFPAAQGSLVAVVVWRATLLAIGVTAASGLVAALATTAERSRALVTAALAGWLVYAWVVVRVSDAFTVAIAAYAPVSVLLLAVFVARFVREGERSALIGALGLAVLLAGSWVQWRRVALHPMYFTHNAVYHLIEMVALPLIHRGARGLVAPRR